MFTADRKHMTDAYQQQLDKYPVDWRVVFIGVNLVARNEFPNTNEIAKGVSDFLAQLRRELYRDVLGRENKHGVRQKYVALSGETEHTASGNEGQHQQDATELLDGWRDNRDNANALIDTD